MHTHAHTHIHMYVCIFRTFMGTLITDSKTPCYVDDSIASRLFPAVPFCQHTVALDLAPMGHYALENIKCCTLVFCLPWKAYAYAFAIVPAVRPKTTPQGSLNFVPEMCT